MRFFGLQAAVDARQVKGPEFMAEWGQWHQAARTDRDWRMRRAFDSIFEANGEYRASPIVTA